MLNLYVTSSEKHIGKTFITSGIAATMQSLGYTTSVYKPIQTSGKELNGFVQSPDLTFLKTIDPYINSHFSYLYKSPLEPIVASEIDNETIDIDYINNELDKGKSYEYLKRNEYKETINSILNDILMKIEIEK